MSGENQEKTKGRFWKAFINDGTKGCDEPRGRYQGNSPYQAANKALSASLQRQKKENIKMKPNEFIKIEMIESTRGSKKRSHHYKGRRIELEEPVKYRAGDQMLEKKHKNYLKKLTKENLKDLEAKKEAKTKTKSKKK